MRCYMRGNLHELRKRFGMGLVYTCACCIVVTEMSIERVRGDFVQTTSKSLSKHDVHIAYYLAFFSNKKSLYRNHYPRNITYIVV